LNSIHESAISPTPLYPTVAANIDIVLEMIRSHLRMDVAFLAEFSDTARVFRGVSARRDNPPIRAGDIHPIGAGYCRKIVDCILPELIPDTADFPVAAMIPETASIPVGAHLSVPVRFGDGHVYGTLCCFSYLPRPMLGQSDLDLLHQLAGLTANMLAADVSAHQRRRRLRKMIDAALSAGDPRIIFQPIVDLASRVVTGYEALSRFAAEPARSPDKWFADAAGAGIGKRIELIAAQKAIVESRRLPAHVSVNINLSPATIMASDLEPLLSLIDPERLVIEITEHAPIEDYGRVETALRLVRQAGVRIAIDDAGAGYSSLLHVLRLQPDIIKFDISLTRGIDADPNRIAMVGALVEYSRRTGTSVVAEGVETPEEEEVLRELRVDKAQGYFYGRPSPVADILTASGLTT
jgi:EAL domain-containing protein (putative c-di-GMP-specific phosphodiesterase class I)